MKLAFISDIHGNFTALRTAVKQLRTMKIDRIYHCGDLVGYYSEPNKVLDLIREENIEGVMGNHDYLTLGGILLKEGKLTGEAKQEIKEIFSNVSNHGAVKVIKFTIEHITEENKKYLMALNEELEFEVEDLHFYLAHGRPSWLGNPLNDYLFAKTAKKLQEAINTKMKEKNINIVVLGHTHEPYILTLKKWSHYVINAGSIGQPRDGVPFSSIVIMKVDTGLVFDVDIIRSMYNIYETQQKAFEEVLPQDIVRRLNFGI